MAMKFRDPKTGEVFEDIDTAIWNKCRRRDPCDTNCPLFKLRKHIACRDYVISHPADAARLMGLEIITDEEEPMEKKDKPRIAWDKIGSKTAVWCKTEEDAKTFLAAAEERGLKWCSGDMPTSHTNWETNKEYTAYIVEPDGLMYSCCSFYKDCDYSIVPYEELLEPVSPRICEVLGSEDNPLEVDEVWCVTGKDRAQYRITYDGNLEYRMPNYNGTGYGRWISTDVPTDFIAHPDRIIRKPRFTEEEIADAKAILRILPHVDTVERMENGLLYCYDREMEQVNICGGLFPSLRPGQVVRLEDIT